MQARAGGLFPIFCVGAAILPAGAAHGQLRFDARVDGWRVVNVAASCLAVNRPVDEFNAAPYNALSFVQARDGRLRLRVHFWPGVFTAGHGRSFTVKFTGGASFALTAKSADGVSLETGEPLSAEFRGALGSNKMLAAIADGANANLAFNIERAGQVLNLLADCARMLR